jgi:hypothetical protein
VGRICRYLFGGFVLGITDEVLVLLFFVILSFIFRRNAFDFGSFRVLRVLEVEAQDLCFREL